MQTLYDLAIHQTAANTVYIHMLPMTVKYFIFSQYLHNYHCIVPPSPPQNVRVINSTDNSIALTWEVPEFDGGRGGLVYGLYYQASDGVRMKFGIVNGTTGEIRGILK